MCRLSRNYESRNLLNPSGPAQAYNGIALTFPVSQIYVYGKNVRHRYTKVCKINHPCTFLNLPHGEPLHKAQAPVISLLKIEVFSATDVNVGMLSSIVDHRSDFQPRSKKAQKI
jgi:hypothetical protein